MSFGPRQPDRARHGILDRKDFFMEHYHMRSNIESAYSMIKAKFGGSVRSKSDTGQINECLCKVLCHNICLLVLAMHDLGIEPNFGSKANCGSEIPLEPQLPRFG